MKQKKIYPYLIDPNRMAGYYELLLDDKFNLKIFSKKREDTMYKYFLPLIRNYMMWTFDLNNISEFKKMSNDLKSAVCSKYDCNIFEKNDSAVICFKEGICFIITEDEKLVSKLVKYEEKQKMQEINLREDTTYEIPEEALEKEESSKTLKEDFERDRENQEHTAYLYTYILELFKLIYLKKLENAIQNPNIFDKARNEYVNFTKEIYDVKITDKNDIQQKWEKDLELEKLHVSIDNKFDLLYKNNKLNENLEIKKILIILFIVLIIIGIINLGNWIG